MKKKKILTFASQIDQKPDFWTRRILAPPPLEKSCIRPCTWAGLYAVRDGARLSRLEVVGQEASTVFNYK